MKKHEEEYEETFRDKRIRRYSTYSSLLDKQYESQEKRREEAHVRRQRMDSYYNSLKQTRPITISLKKKKELQGLIKKLHEKPQPLHRRSTPTFK